MERKITPSIVLARRAGIATTASVALIGALLTLPATAAPDEPDLVHGTYSTLRNNSAMWVDLPSAQLNPEQEIDADATVTIDASQTFQKYNGLGMSIDETAVANLFALPEAERRDVIKNLVSPTEGAGMDLFRIPIGSSDLIQHLPFWSYDELPDGVEDDFDLEYFSIQRDIDMHIIEAIKLIQEYNPDAHFFGSAWSAPAWMTTTNTFVGYVAPNPNGNGFYQASKLRDDCIDVFARYYAEFIKAYGEQGIVIDAITLLNEPGMDVVYPAMDISIEQQQKLALAIKATFEDAGLSADLWMHDFNFWDWRDPNSTETKNYYRIFEDSADGSITREDMLEAVDGIAFHPYWGESTVMRDANEETGLATHMTETSAHSATMAMEYLRLNVSSHVLWAQITDQTGGTLHWTDRRDNNVDWDQIGRTAKWRNRLVTANLQSGKASYRVDLGGFGQIARYLDKDDIRVQSNDPNNLVTAVFRDSDNNFTAIVQNTGNARTVRFEMDGQNFTSEIPGQSMATFQWEGAKDNTVEVSTASRCVAGKVTLVTSISNKGDDAVSGTINTPFGSKNVTVNAGKSASQAFSTRSVTMPAGEATFEVEGGEPITNPFEAANCQ